MSMAKPVAEIVGERVVRWCLVPATCREIASGSSNVTISIVIVTFQSGRPYYVLGKVFTPA
jgi:hypothetical protein